MRLNCNISPEKKQHYGDWSQSSKNSLFVFNIFTSAPSVNHIASSGGCKAIAYFHEILQT